MGMNVRTGGGGLRSRCRTRRQRRRALMRWQSTWGWLLVVSDNVYGRRIRVADED